MKAHRRGIRGTIALLACALAAGCGTDDVNPDAATVPVDTPTAEATRARRDSAIAGSRLPGAQGVRGAMEAAETARRRAEATDTLLP